MPLSWEQRSGIAPSKFVSNMSLRHLYLGIDISIFLYYTDSSRRSLYGDGEELLGKWFKRTGKRDQIFLATKFGYVKGSKTLEVNSSASYCKEACAESLRNLGVDSIDLCKSHFILLQDTMEKWKCLTFRLYTLQF